MQIFVKKKKRHMSTYPSRLSSFCTFLHLKIMSACILFAFSQSTERHIHSCGWVLTKTCKMQKNSNLICQATDLSCHWLSQTVALEQSQKAPGSWLHSECSQMTPKTQWGSHRQHVSCVASHIEGFHTERRLWKKRDYQKRKKIRGTLWNTACYLNSGSDV